MPPSQDPQRRKFLLGALAAPAIGVLLDACGGSGNPPANSGGADLKIARPDHPVTWPIAADNAPIPNGQKPERGATLRLYNYADYIDPAALKSFEKKYRAYDVKVQLSTFNDQSEAIGKLRSGKVDFDLYFPGYDIIGKLVTAKLIRPLNHSYITNIGQIWPVFQNPFYDGGWRYTVPYTVYTTGIGWRSDRVTEDVGARPNPYDVFWDPRYAKKLSILDDYRDAIAMVLLRNHRDINTTAKADLDLALQQLKSMSQTTHPKVTITDYTDVPAGQVPLAQAWSGDMVNALSYLPKGTGPEVLRYWFPSDGKGMVDNDLMVIPRAGKNPVLAHLFIDHMLDYDVAIANFGAIGYQPPQNKITPAKLVEQEFMPQNLAAATVLPEYFTAGYRTLELSPAVDARWHAVWQQFKAGV